LLDDGSNYKKFLYIYNSENGKLLITNSIGDWLLNGIQHLASTPFLYASASNGSRFRLAEISSITGKLNINFPEYPDPPKSPYLLAGNSAISSVSGVYYIQLSAYIQKPEQYLAFLAGVDIKSGKVLHAPQLPDYFNYNNNTDSLLTETLHTIESLK